MSLKAVTFTDGARSVCFELDSSSSLSGIGDVFSKFLDPGERDVSGIVQTWGSGLCGVNRVSKSCECGARVGAEVFVEDASLGCDDGGKLFGESAPGGSTGLAAQSVSTEASSVGGATGGLTAVDPKTIRNRIARQARKDKKKKRQLEGKDWRAGPVLKSAASSESLRSSLEKKWQIENELAAEKAHRQLEILRASDIEQEKRKYRTKISADTERNMVSIEKTHASLRQTGNLPEERGGGFAETVVSGVPGLESGSGTISPDSSASMAEFRACQKALLDSENDNKELRRKIAIATKKYHVPVELVDYLEKEVWTDNRENSAILDELYPDGYGKNTSYVEDGYFVPC